jgi:acyl-CoA reductase-like NAD-dependent aldehyde dehydrogenase
MGTDTATDARPRPAGAYPDLDRLLDELRAGAERWAGTSVADRAALIRAVHEHTGRAAESWTRAAAAMKHLDPASAAVGEEWITGPYALLTATDRLARTLDELAAGRSPIAGARFHAAPGGRRAVDVMPLTWSESLLLHGFSAEVWFPPGVTDEQAVAAAGLGARPTGEQQGVGLVLGAGNITSIPPLDVLSELVAGGRAVILKLNPVMAGLLGPLTDALAPLIRFGVLRIVQGGAEVGAFLAHHPSVTHVHITGSAGTHDAVVFGTGTEGERRKAAGAPLLTKPITSELGGVSPVIVVPGRWTDRELAFQAEHVATQRLHNGGYDCIAAQVVLISRDWAQKDAFLRHLRRALDEVPARSAWYPGSTDRSAAALALHPEAERLGPDGDRLLLAANDAPDVTRTEYFAPVLGVIELPGIGGAFLDEAVRIANDELAGTLGANVIIRPDTRRALGSRFGRAIEALRYGTIGINAWTGVGFLLAAVPWGAYPGNPITDVGSGRGIVHNALLLEGCERTVVRGPFRPFPASALAGEWTLSPRPPWFVTARTAATTGRRMTRFAAKPSIARLPGILLAAFRG